LWLHNSRGEFETKLVMHVDRDWNMFGRVKSWKQQVLGMLRSHPHELQLVFYDTKDNEPFVPALGWQVPTSLLPSYAYMRRFGIRDYYADDRCFMSFEYTGPPTHHMDGPAWYRMYLQHHPDAETFTEKYINPKIETYNQGDVYCVGQILVATLFQMDSTLEEMEQSNTANDEGMTWTSLVQLCDSHLEFMKRLRTPNWTFCMHWVRADWDNLNEPTLKTFVEKHVDHQHGGSMICDRRVGECTRMPRDILWRTRSQDDDKHIKPCNPFHGSQSEEQWFETNYDAAQNSYTDLFFLMKSRLDPLASAALSFLPDSRKDDWQGWRPDGMASWGGKQSEAHMVRWSVMRCGHGSFNINRTLCKAFHHCEYGKNTDPDERAGKGVCGRIVGPLQARGCGRWMGPGVRPVNGQYGLVDNHHVLFVYCEDCKTRPLLS